MNEKRPQRIIRLLTAALCAAVVVIAVLGVQSAREPYRIYRKAAAAEEEGNYELAASLYGSLCGFTDSDEKRKEAVYHQALAALEEGKIEEAEGFFAGLGSYKDSCRKIEECHFLRGKAYTDQGEYRRALFEFADSGNPEEAGNYEKECHYRIGLDFLSAGDYREALEEFGLSGDFGDSGEKILECRYGMAEELLAGSGTTLRAIAAFRELGDFRDSKEKTAALEYSYVCTHMTPDNPLTRKYAEHLAGEDYLDAADLYQQLFRWSVRITVNDSPEDLETDLDAASKDITLWWHILVLNGPPDASLEVRAVAVYPNGMQIDEWDGSSSFTIEKGEGFTTSTYYLDPENGASGDMTFCIYDMEGSLLGERTIVLT